MPKFENIVEKSTLIEEDKKMLSKILAEQDQKITKRVKTLVEKDPDMLQVFVDLIKLKILGNKKLNKRYLKTIVNKKLQEIIS